MTTTQPVTWRPLGPAERRRLTARAQLLAATSVAYNVIEVVIAVTAGVLAGSVALVGFGPAWTRSWRAPAV